MKTVFYKKLSSLHIAIMDLTYCDLIPSCKGYMINRINVPMNVDASGTPLYRGRGIGSELLRECIADADKEGVRLLLEINASNGLTREQLEAWYIRHGFKEHQQYPGLYVRESKLTAVE